MYARKIGCLYKVPQQDIYKDKVVVWGYIVDTNQQPLKEAKVLFKNQQLATTNQFGEFFIIIGKGKKNQHIQFEKEGYKATVFSFEEERDVYEPVLVLHKLLTGT